MIHNTIKHLPKKHRITLFAVSLLLVLLILWPSDNVVASRTTGPASVSSEIIELALGVKYDVPIPEFIDNSIPDTLEADPASFVSHKVKRGDTLAKIFSNFNTKLRKLFKSFNYEF